MQLPLHLHTIQHCSRHPQRGRIGGVDAEGAESEGENEREPSRSREGGVRGVEGEVAESEG